MTPDRHRRRTAPPGVGASSRARRSSSPAIRRSIPSRFKEGLRPWQPKKFYFIGRFRRAGRPDRRRSRRARRIDLSVYDPLLGKTYAEIGTEARSMHKCQGMAQLLALPGPSASTYQLAESTIPGQAGARRDVAVRRRRHDDSRPGAVRRRAAAAGARRRPGGDRVGRPGGAEASSTPTATTRRCRRCSPACARCARCAASCSAMTRSTMRRGSRSTSGSSRRSASSSRRFCSPNGVRIEALADDGVVVPGQPVKVSRDRREPRRRRRHGQAGEVRRLRRRRRMRADRRRPPAAVGRRAAAAAAAAASRAAAAAISTLKKDQVARCDADVEDSRQRARHRAVLASRRRGRPLHLRRRRAVRAAVPADAVHVQADARRIGSGADAKKSSTRCRCSIATKATSSAARSGPSCWSCRRSRCACRRTSRSSRSRASAAPAARATRRRRGAASTPPARRAKCASRW